MSTLNTNSSGTIVLQRHRGGKEDAIMTWEMFKNIRFYYKYYITI